MTACHEIIPVPVLHTKRLRLVAWEERHFECFAELHSDPETMRHIGDSNPLDRVGAWLHLATLIGHWQLRGYGVWAVEEAGGNELIGRAGLLHPEGWPDAELNWMIKPSMRGRGLATEAASVALRFAFDQLGLERVVSLIRPENAASLRVAAKIGGSLDETVDFMGRPVHVFRYTCLP